MTSQCSPRPLLRPISFALFEWSSAKLEVHSSALSGGAMTPPRDQRFAVTSKHVSVSPPSAVDLAPLHATTADVALVDAVRRA